MESRLKTKIYQNNSDIIKQLLIQDPKLSDLFDEPKQITVQLQDDYFLSLFGAIISQQLSSRVSEVIYNRVLDYYSGELSPIKVFSTDTEALRECGLSYRKVEYIKSLAEKILSKEVVLEDLDVLSNQEIINMLVKIKGIGPWTAEMFLIFSLGRENVFSVLDLGLRNGLMKLYNQELPHETMIEISRKWEPYQTVVSHYLWRYNARK